MTVPKGIRCRVLSDEFVKSNGISSEMVVGKCGPLEEVSMLTYAIASGKTVIFIGLKGLTPAFDHNYEIFLQSLKNLRTNVRNSLPVANAGRNQIVPEGSEVILDGSRSNDRDGQIESHQWQQVCGPKINLGDENKIKPEFVAPSVQHDAILVLRPIVTDEKGGSDSAITSVKINNEQSTPSLPNVPDFICFKF